MRRTLNDSFNKIANTEKASRKKTARSLYIILPIYFTENQR